MAGVPYLGLTRLFNGPISPISMRKCKAVFVHKINRKLLTGKMERGDFLFIFVAEFQYTLSSVYSFIVKGTVS